MLSRVLAIALIFASASLLCLPSDEQKPVCDADTNGQFWPEAANHDSKLLKKFSRCGELEVCARTRYRYRWESITVRIDQLRGGSQLHKPAGCEVQPDAVGDENYAGSDRSGSPEKLSRDREEALPRKQN
jgi:hypothetical protein